MNLRILLILGALSAFGPLAIDFYLPSFPTLAKAFATDVEHVQLSLPPTSPACPSASCSTARWPTAMAGACRCWWG